jgi:hypothetical protein
VSNKKHSTKTALLTLFLPSGICRVLHLANLRANPVVIDANKRHKASQGGCKFQPKVLVA